jgi:hypothetical protein
MHTPLRTFPRTETGAAAFLLAARRGGGRGCRWAGAFWDVETLSAAVRKAGAQAVLPST